MDKPITLSIEDFKQELSKVINNSQLHIFIIDSILKDIYNEIHMIYQNQIERDKKMYEEKNIKSDIDIQGDKKDV